MSEYTSIQVSKETRDNLKRLALTPSESYEQILLRLIDAKMGGREVEYLIRNSDEDCNVKAVVDWGIPEKNIKFFDKDGDRNVSVPIYDFDDEEFQKKWDAFVENIHNLENIVNILAILDYGESIRAGDIILSRL